MLLLSLLAAGAFPTGKLYYRLPTGTKPVELWVARLRGGKVIQKSRVPGVKMGVDNWYGPFVSPNQRFVVFSVQKEQQQSYFLRDLVKGQTRPLPNIPQWVTLRWASDNRHLLIAKSDFSFYRYTLFDTATGLGQEIPDRYSRADWMPDGKTLLLTKVERATTFFSYKDTLKPLPEAEVDRQMGSCFRVALNAALVPNRQWQYDNPWADLEFSPSRRLAVYTLVDPRENSYSDDGGVPTMASYIHLPMFTILRDAKGQKAKIEIGSRNGFLPLAWSKDERAILGRLADYHFGEFALIQNGKLSTAWIAEGAIPVAFFPEAG